MSLLDGENYRGNLLFATLPVSVQPAQPTPSELTAKLGGRQGEDVPEAILPSLVTKTAPPNAKGAATGVYSGSQFLGIFAGGAGGGAILANWGPHGVWTFVGALAIAWLLTALTMRRPIQRLS